MRIMKANQAVQQQGIKLLIYGEAGAGKTTLCATTPDLDKTLVLSAEAGLLSIQHVDVDVAVVQSVKELRDAYAVLKRQDCKYRWVCLDSISEIAEMALKEELGRAKDGRKAYGEMASKVIDLVKAFRDLPLNVVMLAKHGTQEDDGRLRRIPLFPGRKLSEELPYLFDEVFALRVFTQEDGSIVRKLMCQPDGTWQAKDRSGKLEEFEDADLTTVAMTIHAGSSTEHAPSPTTQPTARKSGVTDEAPTDGRGAKDGATLPHERDIPGIGGRR